VRTLDEFARRALQRSARRQSSIRSESEIRFPPCWQMKAGAVFIVAGCGSIFVLILASPRHPSDPPYVFLFLLMVLASLPLAVLVLLPGRVAIDPTGIKQRFWWRSEKRIAWTDFASAIRDRDTGSTIVYGKFTTPITFSPYLVDQSGFDREMKAISRTTEIPEDI